jgi:hypothetical protein
MAGIEGQIAALRVDIQGNDAGWGCSMELHGHFGRPQGDYQ